MKIKKIILISIILSAAIYFFISNTTNYVFAGTLSDNVEAIDNNKYPGFKDEIKSLQQKNPNFSFQVYYTGIDWNEAINREYQGHGASPLNLFNSGTSYQGMWYCPICGKKSYDNGSLYCASKEAIAYMMDPRNSLTVDSVFQFKTLETSDVTIADITRVVTGKGSFINNTEAIQAIYDSSTTYNVNGYYLIAKILNEHGNNGSTLTSGTYSGFEGIYNYFNIGAYGNSSSIIINNGLTYAKNKGWSSIRASILGGSEIVKDQYIGKKQNTLYYQKFNVVYESSLFSHQYQQNIMAAESQSRSLKTYYNSSTSVNHIFIIPLYENMPSSAAPRPNTSIQNSYKYEEGKITNVSSSLKVRATPNGTEIGKLNNGETVKIIERATEKVGGYYWDLIVSNINGTYGYAAREVGGSTCITGTGVFVEQTVGSNPITTTTPDQVVEVGLTTSSIAIEGTYINVSPDITKETLKNKYPNASITDSTGAFGTGCTITIDGKNYTLVKKGDVDGNGTVNIMDLILIWNHLGSDSSSKITDSAKLKASQVKTDEGDTSIIDVIVLFNYL